MRCWATALVLGPGLRLEVGPVCKRDLGMSMPAPRVQRGLGHYCPRPVYKPDIAQPCTCRRHCDACSRTVTTGWVTAKLEQGLPSLLLTLIDRMRRCVEHMTVWSMRPSLHLDDIVQDCDAQDPDALLEAVRRGAKHLKGEFSDGGYEVGGGPSAPTRAESFVRL